MRRLVLPAIAAASIIAVVALAADKGKSDQDAIQGTWGIVSVEIDKQLMPSEMAADARLVINSEKYSFALSDTKLELAYKLHPDKTPKAIDLTVTEGSMKDQTYYGIYKLDGDTYTVCRSNVPGKPRPTEFATTPDSGLMLVVWKRIKG
jgi:uncharacterized protein (TIGR03067 family)